MDLATARWWKSSYSSIGGCVEVAMQGDEVAVRDSKDPEGPVLEFSRSEWATFLEGIRDGEFNA